MIRFIDEYRDRFSVEFICETLNTHRVGGFITSRGYRQSKARGMSARSLRDAALVVMSRDVVESVEGYAANRRVVSVVVVEVEPAGQRQASFGL